MNTFKCPCLDGRKSFYGKAIVVDTGTDKFLLSYKTPVVVLDINGGVQRLWGGYSSTTMRHINSFLRLYKRKVLTKKEWESLPTVEIPTAVRSMLLAC